MARFALLFAVVLASKALAAPWMQIRLSPSYPVARGQLFAIDLLVTNQASAPADLTITVAHPDGLTFSGSTSFGGLNCPAYPCVWTGVMLNSGGRFESRFLIPADYSGPSEFNVTVTVAAGIETIEGFAHVVVPPPVDAGTPDAGAEIDAGLMTLDAGAEVDAGAELDAGAETTADAGLVGTLALALRLDGAAYENTSVIAYGVVHTDGPGVVDASLAFSVSGSVEPLSDSDCTSSTPCRFALPRGATIEMPLELRLGEPGLVAIAVTVIGNGGATTSTLPVQVLPQVQPQPPKKAGCSSAPEPSAFFVLAALGFWVTRKRAAR